MRKLPEISIRRTKRKGFRITIGIDFASNEALASPKGQRVIASIARTMKLVMTPEERVAFLERLNEVAKVAKAEATRHG